MRRLISEICLCLVVGGALSMALTGTASAAEQFLCSDGRMIKLDASNRDALANDPCVKDWFAARDKASVTKSKDVEGASLRRREPETVVIHRYNRSRRIQLGE